MVVIVSKIWVDVLLLVQAVILKVHLLQPLPDVPLDSALLHQMILLLQSQLFFFSLPLLKVFMKLRQCQVDHVCTIIHPFKVDQLIQLSSQLLTIRFQILCFC